MTSWLMDHIVDPGRYGFTERKTFFYYLKAPLKED